MDIPTIKLPDTQQIKTISIPLPTADVPYYTPLVVPPSDLRDQEAKPVKTEEKVEVIVTAVTTAVTAVAATTLTQPIIENIRKKVQKFLQGKINKWRQNRQKKKESLASSKKM